MALMCPQCKQIFEKSGVCPLCNVILLYHAENSKLETTPVSEDRDPPQWQQTPWGKIAIGLILTQGLSFGGQHLLTAGVLVTGDGFSDDSGLWGIIVRHAIHAVALLVGGAIAGAGQSRGIVYGALIGLVSGIIALVMRAKTEDFSSFIMYLEPCMHLVMGALGGGLGMLIWQPLPSLPDLGTTTPSPIPSAALGAVLARFLAGPIHFGRVCAGAFFVVIGVVWSEAILEFLLRASNGTFRPTSQLQAQLIAMEISGLAILIGSSLAGANTRNGFKQGLCTGFGASAIVLGIEISKPKFTPESGALLIAGIIVVSLVGGWFGGQLFPPLADKRRRLSAY